MPLNRPRTLPAGVVPIAFQTAAPALVLGFAPTNGTAPQSHLETERDGSR
jgi:hypothetical protein